MRDAIQTLDNPSTRGHDEPRSEDRDPLKNPEQRTQETILITLPGSKVLYDGSDTN